MGPGGLPNIEDSGRDAPNILSELARVRCIFQLRAIATAIGVPAALDEPPLNAVEGGEQPMPAFAPVAVPAPFHADPTTQADGEHHA